MEAVFLLKHVITEHTIPYEVYHNYLFVDIFVCPSCTRTCGPHLYDVMFCIHEDGSKYTSFM